MNNEPKTKEAEEALADFDEFVHHGYRFIPDSCFMEVKNPPEALETRENRK
jgi:hypothetical protein